MILASNDTHPDRLDSRGFKNMLIFNSGLPIENSSFKNHTIYQLQIKYFIATKKSANDQQAIINLSFSRAGSLNLNICCFRG